jgi:hypothetical protein
MPKYAATFTLPLLIGRNHQRLGMPSYAEWMDAARSDVRFRHD